MEVIMNAILTVFCLMLLVSGCDLSVTPLSQKPEEETIEIISYVPEKEYIELGFIEIESTKETSQDLVNQLLIERAQEFGTDALINLKYSEAEAPFANMAASSPTMVNKRYTSATAIKYTE